MPQAKSLSTQHDKIKRSAHKARRAWLRTSAYGVLAASVILGLGVAALAYKRNHDALHDLSVVGNGIPTVVQVHDPQCRLCQQLRGNLFAATQNLPPDQLQIRIADITSSAGASFASLHNSPHVTLLVFSARGELLDQLHGVKSQEEISRALKNLLRLPT